MASIFDEAMASIGASIGAAVSDVREKYEESVWGRAVTGGEMPSEPPESGVAPPAAVGDETPQIACLFDQKLDTIITAPSDPDLQPHGQVLDR